MRELGIFTFKEVSEVWRNKKVIWVPLVMILIAVMDPITVYFMPEILKLSGGLPEGAVIDFPTPLPAEVLMMSVSQVSMFGVLLIVLMSMGAISNERRSEVIEVILSKPIRPRNFFLAKWLTYNVIGLGALMIALLTSFYYVNILFGAINLGDFFIVYVLMGLWISFIISLVFLLSSFMKSAGAIAAATLGSVIFISMANLFLNIKYPFYIGNFKGLVSDYLISHSISNDLLIASCSLLFLIICLTFLGQYIFTKRDYS